MNFNPRPPRGGATANLSSLSIFFLISIHAPREGGDDHGTVCVEVDDKFQSTPPARGATLHLLNVIYQTGISIHAPREGGDDT